MTQQPIKRVLCNGKAHPQCAKCARQTEKPDAFKPPEFVNQKCPMRVQK